MKVDRDAVARKAGVSTATVSRVFNSPETVSEEKRKRVLDAARLLEYSPNKFASALARRSSGRILFLDGKKLSTHDARNDDFYASLFRNSLEAVLSEIDRSSYHLTIDSDGSGDPSGYDGAIIFDVDSEQQLQPFLDAGIPLVFGHHVAHFPEGCRFAVDNRAGARLAAEHLHRSGHRRPACITAKISEINSHAARLQGFLDVYPERDVRIIEGCLGPGGGSESTHQLIPLIRNGKVDCISVVNDLTAYGVVQELLREGIRIPEEVSIVSFDNLPVLKLLPLPLTTLDLRLPELYRRAATMLLAKLAGGPEAQEEYLQLVVPGLVPGQSVRNR